MNANSMQRRRGDRAGSENMVGKDTRRDLAAVREGEMTPEELAAKLTKKRRRAAVWWVVAACWALAGVNNMFRE